MSWLILIATRNRWDNLRICLDSIQGLRLGEFVPTVRVVDNGSQDGSYEELLQYARESSRLPIEVLREETPGKSAALNHGLAALNHSFIAFTDDDTEVDSGWLLALHRHFESSCCAGIRGLTRVKLLIPRPAWFTRSCERLLGGTVDLEDHPGREVRSLSGANMAVRAEVLAKIGLFRKELGPADGVYRTGEDSEWSHRLIAGGGKLCHCPGAVVYHRVPGSMINRRYLWARQFEYVRGEYAWKRYRGLLPAANWQLLVREFHDLIGALLRRTCRFEGFDYGLEIAARFGRVAAHLDSLFCLR